MGRFKALPLMMSLLLLVGCAAGGGGEEPTGEDLALAIQKEFSQMTACTCRVELSADYGDKVFDCAVDVRYDAGGVELILAEPEIARGVTARIARGETTLSYGDFSLDAGPLTGEGLTPVGAVPALWAQIARGYIAGTRLEEQTLRVTYRQGENAPGVGLEAEVVFDVQTHAPLTGELFYDGVRVIAAQVSDFQMMGPQDQG